MMTRIVCSCALALLVACGGESEPSPADTQEAFTGVLSGTLNGRPIRSPVRCTALESEQFRFRSPPAEDGELSASGMQMGEKLIFDISLQGQSYSTPNLSIFNKSDRGADGAGPVFPEGGGAQAALVFQLRC